MRTDRRARAAIAVASGVGFLAAVVVAVGSLTGLIPLSPTVTTALTVLLAALGLLPSTLLASQPQDLHAVATRLAGTVENRETRLFDDLVGTAAPMDLQFSRRSVPGRQASAAPARGRLREVASFYQQVESGRLVIVGPGGAGKTVLLLELLIRLLDGARAPDTPVPVRVSLSRWDLTLSLPEWLATEVASQNELPYTAARRLVDAGLILPMLDGLDEMDPESAVHPGRAAAAVRRLNAYRRGSRPGPLVLTCRDHVYDRLVEEREQLADAVTVAVAELRSQQIQEHIRKIVADNRRWTPVLRTLARQPTGPLARELQLPWRLAMVLSLFEERPDGRYLRDPAQLTAAADRPAGIELVPLYAAALLASPLVSRGERGASRTRRALAMLGTYLLTNLDRRRVIGGRLLPSVDMVVHQLWPVAGLRSPRAVTALLSAILWLPTAVAAIWLLRRASWPDAIEAAILGVGAVFPVASIRSSLQWWPHPRNIVIGRLREGRAQIRLLLTGGVAVVIGLLTAAIGGPGFAVAFAAGFGGVFGLGIALAVRDTAPTSVLIRVGAAVGLLLGWLAQTLLGFLGAVGGVVTGAAAGGLALITAVTVAVRAPQATPGHATNPVFRSFVRNDFQTGVTAGLAAAGLVALVLSFSPDLEIAVLPAGLVCLAVGCSVGLGMVADTWRRYAAMLLCARGRLPLRFDRLLQRAYSAGLLRRAGIAYQFRHLELRDYFGARG